MVVLALLLLALAWLYRASGRAARIDWGSPWLNRIDGLNRLFCRWVHGLRSEPLPLPDTGGALVAANHLSGLDPLLLIAASRRPLRFLIAREQYQRFGLNWLFRAVGCIPVDRSGRPEAALKAALEALQQGEVVALFPHGGIHLDHQPPRRLKRGIAWLARQAGCPVVPVRIDGVTARGLTILAVFVPSRARLRASAALACDRLDEHDCLEQLAAAIAPQPSSHTSTK